jgi:branched-chain amino acid transport system ATP-binding protein
MPLLKVSDLHVYYAKSHALHGINIEVNSGEVVALLGANGAGKTTTLWAISGLITPTTGKIEFAGQDITGLAPHKIVQLGLIHAPQGRRIFPQMTIYENLEMGALLFQDKRQIEEDCEKVYELFPVLSERKKQVAGTLSGGEQQMLAIARALMGRPKLLMMDEPSMGLAPVMITELYRKIDEISKSGITILLVEQNAAVAFEVASRAYFLETGNIVLSGETKNIEASDVVKAYLN